MNPAALNLGENTADPKADGKNGYYFLWTSDLDGTLTVTMETESGWSYSAANLTTGELGEVHYSHDEEPVWSETIRVHKGDQIRIVVNAHSSDEEPFGTDGIVFTAAAATEESETMHNTEEPA